MAAELHPPGSPYTHPTGPPAAPSAPATDNPSSSLAPKRHRRPSVRLGDIGDQPATLRAAKSWRLNPHREPNPSKSSKIRPLTNLATTTINGNFNPHSDYSAETATTTTTTNIINNNGNPHRKFAKEFKPKRTATSAKRVRTADLKIGEPGEEAEEERENGGNNDNDIEDDIDEEGFRNFDPEGSEQEEQQSPVNSADDVAILDAWHGHNRRSIRVPGTSATRVSDSHHDLELDGFPESDSRSRGGTGIGLGLDDGVRNWLVGLGLGRYAPVFEIHEVDDEVLPYLTLEDLKDMGINAVGSRRKLYYAIQKLRKGLS